MKRAALVVADETARHPFLASLPPHVRAPEDAAKPRTDWRFSTKDVREFLIAYCACFMAVTLYIA